MKRLRKVFSCTLLSALVISTTVGNRVSAKSQTVSKEQSGYVSLETFQSKDIKSITDRKSVLNESDIVYMILTDRFKDGDPTNNGTLGKEYRPGQLKYTQGGDWKGITQKLDYIKDLGVTAIWISPPSENELLSRDGQESGYHGYFTHDYNKADPHYGTK